MPVQSSRSRPARPQAAPTAAPARPTRRGATSANGGQRERPAKPYPDFPLFPHATGRWAKKIRGRFAFFGPWADAQGALERYLAERDDLMAGRVPRGRPVGVNGAGAEARGLPL